MNKTTTTSFHQAIIKLVKRIPKGKVATYGQIALLAGNPRGARQVVWALNTSSERENLPWFRIVNKQGRISLPHGGGYELQKSLLKKEGVKFNLGDIIDLNKYLWIPRRI